MFHVKENQAQSHTIGHLPAALNLFIKARLRALFLLLVIIKDWGVRSMISIPGSLSFVMSFAPAKKNLRGMPDYASQDPSIHSFRQSMLSHTISTPIRIKSTFFLILILISFHSYGNKTNFHMCPLISTGVVPGYKA